MNKYRPFMKQTKELSRKFKFNVLRKDKLIIINNKSFKTWEHAYYYMCGMNDLYNKLQMSVY